MIQKLVFTLVLGITSLLATNLEVQINECKSGNVQSCYAAATALTTGKNAENQEKKTLGLDLMRKACKFGEEKACDALGDNYYIDKHYQAAKPYLIKSCMSMIFWIFMIKNGSLPVSFETSSMFIPFLSA